MTNRDHESWANCPFGVKIKKTTWKKLPRQRLMIAKWNWWRCFNLILYFLPKKLSGWCRCRLLVPLGQRQCCHRGDNRASLLAIDLDGLFSVHKDLVIRRHHRLFRRFRRFVFGFPRVISTLECVYGFLVHRQILCLCQLTCLESSRFNNYHHLHLLCSASGLILK